MTQRPPADLDSTLATLVALTDEPKALAERWEALRDAVVIRLIAAVARGDLDAARRTREALQAAQPFIDRHQPPEGPALAEAASALANLLLLAHLGSEALERPAIEQGAEHPNDTTRAVLAVLQSAGEGTLTRGEVHGQLPELHRKTPARISQILDELTRLGLTTRTRVANGERVTGYFGLSAAGQSLCRRLGIGAVEAGAVRLARVVGSAKSKGITYNPQAMLELMPAEINWSMQPERPAA